MNVEQFYRKSFPVDAVRVTSDNMQEVAEWCDGHVEGDGVNDTYIKVRVQNPLNERQTKAYVGDWVLYAGKGYKVYKNSAFRNSFDAPERPRVDANVFDQTNSDPVVPSVSGDSENPGGTHVVGE